MAWTYDVALPTNKDKVRLLTGDVDTTDQLISDEGIAFLLTQEPNVYLAASATASAIAGGLARKISRSIGDVSVALQQQYEHYVEIAADLRDRGYGMGAFVPYAGGISLGDKDGVADNTDRVQPAFARGTGRNPSLGANAAHDEAE